MVKKEYTDNIEFGTRTIQKNNIYYILNPLEYVQNKFSKYTISNSDIMNNIHYNNANKLVIQEVRDNKVYYKRYKLI